jgi:hypothetical protein
MSAVGNAIILHTGRPMVENRKHLEADRARRIASARRSGLIEGFAMVLAPWRRQAPPRPMIRLTLGSLYDDMQALEDDARRLLDGDRR